MVDWAALVSPGFLPALAFVLLELGLATTIIALRPHDRANRAFAIFLFFAAITTLFDALGTVSAHGDPDVGGGAGYWTRVATYSLLAMPFPLLYFACVWPKPRRWMPSGWKGALPFIVGALAWEGIYVADHGTFGYTDGPLSIVVEPSIAAVALVFALDFARAPGRAAARGALLVSLGFACYTAWNGVDGIVWDAEADLSPFALTRAGQLDDGIQIVFVAATLAVLARAAVRRPQARRAVGWYAGLVVFALLSAVGPLIVGVEEYGWRLATFGLWSLFHALVTSYAIARHQLLGLDAKVRWTLKQSTIAAAFIAVFFAAQEATQALLDERSVSVGIGAAALLVFLLAPLQRFAERLSSRALPNGAPVRDWDMDERTAVYREALHLAWANGTVTRAERLHLAKLRERLGISPDTADRLEHELLSRSA